MVTRVLAKALKYILYSIVLSIRPLGVGEVETFRKPGAGKDGESTKAEHTCKNSIVIIFATPLDV